MTALTKEPKDEIGTTVQWRQVCPKNCDPRERVPVLTGHHKPLEVGTFIDHNQQSALAPAALSGD